MKKKIRFIRQRCGLAPLVVLAFCPTLFGFSLTGFLPVIVQTIFHKGPETYELLLVFSGAGSISGALIVFTMERLKKHRRVALMTLAILGTATTAFAFSPLLPLSCILIPAAGAAIMASASLMLSLVQLIVQDRMRGRVMSVATTCAFRAGIPVERLSPLGRDHSASIITRYFRSCRIWVVFWLLWRGLFPY